MKQWTGILNTSKTATDQWKRVPIRHCSSELLRPFDQYGLCKVIDFIYESECLLRGILLAIKELDFARARVAIASTFETTKNMAHASSRATRTETHLNSKLYRGAAIAYPTIDSYPA